MFMATYFLSRGRYPFLLWLWGDVGREYLLSLSFTLSLDSTCKG